MFQGQPLKVRIKARPMMVPTYVPQLEQHSNGHSYSMFYPYTAHTTPPQGCTFSGEDWSSVSTPYHAAADVSFCLITTLGRSDWTEKSNHQSSSHSLHWGE